MTKILSVNPKHSFMVHAFKNDAVANEALQDRNEAVEVLSKTLELLSSFTEPSVSLKEALR